MRSNEPHRRDQPDLILGLNFSFAVKLTSKKRMQGHVRMAAVLCAIVAAVDASIERCQRCDRKEPLPREEVESGGIFLEIFLDS